ncbi:hypothetical protein HMPREF1608_01404 [Escherichia coli 908525]|uniref:Uncharacterized protein n=1 Tax=Escherichia coli (strain SMS-3-5 / SECEC) TaxID=439855 RepID=B1LMT2_ECOSM|nr:hypothetical protein EcSMS35_4283 [Escherichia coli SMS-3-5]ESD08441.1 hypothetical protein HMPREF1595_02249 [Escherichia coli 907672]ESD76443.1 hypothetical protein HMPREF1608_01404 [Escherichia coli 908525]
MYSFFNTHNPSPTIENTSLFLQPVQGLLFHSLIGNIYLLTR